MKNLRKLLSAITVLGLITVSAVNVIACNIPAKKTDLNTIITTKNLDSIYIGQLNTPNKEQILKSIQNKNPDATDLTTNDFIFQQGSTETTSATIVGQGQYRGEVNLNYISNNFKVISNKFNNDIYRMFWTNDNILYIGLNCWNNKKNSGVLLKSTDGGKTFNHIANVIGKEVNSIITNENKNIWVATDEGLYTSIDGSNFYKILNDNVSSLTTDNDKNILVGTNDGVLYKSSLKIIKFKKIKKFDGTIWSLDFLSKSKILYLGIAISGYSGSGELYTSTDEIKFHKNPNIDNEVTTIVVAPNDIVYVGTYKSYGKGNLYKSIDGINFTIFNKINYSVFSLTADNQGNIYIGTELAMQQGKIFKLDASSNLKETFGISTTAWCLVIDNKNNIYAGTGVAGGYSPGIYESTIYGY